MARYGGRKQKYDIRDVHQVAMQYNRIWRDYSGFPQEGRPSDYDLWRHGKPAIKNEGTVGEGVARLRMVFQGFREEDAEAWAHRFIRDNKVPYTDIEVKPRRNLRGDVLMDDGQVPNYIIVNVEFRMHPDFRNNP